MSTAGPDPRPSAGALSINREATLVFCCAAVFLCFATLRALDLPAPYYDDVGFLDLGNQARELGGPLGLLQALFAGRWSDDWRNPLYVALLSLVAGRDPAYHARALTLTVALGVLALLSCWWVARRHLGRRPALVLLVFLSLSETLIAYSGRESAEPLLLICWAFATGALLDGVRQQKPSRWLLAGVFAGLAQLCKGSGLFFIFCFALALLLTRGPRALRDPWAWGMGLTFAAAASPLLVRNVRLYGSPLHHWNNRLLWIDRLPDFAEIYAPHALDRLPHGFLDYLHRTTFLRLLWERVVLGLGETAVHLGDAMSLVSPRPFGPLHLVWVVLGFAAGIWAVRLLWRAPPSFERTFFLVQAAFFAAFFVFFSVAGGSSRYLFPMTISLAAVAARELLARAKAQGTWRRGLPALAAAAALIAPLVALAAQLGNPTDRALPPGFEETQVWLEQKLRTGEAYAVDSRSHLEPEWRLPASNQMVIVSSTWERKPLTPEELLSWLREERVRYAVIDASSHKDASARYFFFDKLRLTPDGSLPPSGFPEGTRLAWADPGRHFFILDLQGESVPAPQPPTARGEE